MAKESEFLHQFDIIARDLLDIHKFEIRKKKNLYYEFKFRINFKPHLARPSF
jgi:hypothetical protein